MNQRRSVRRPDEFSDFINRLLGRTPHGAAAPFETIRDILVFAASVGLAKGAREEFSRTAEPVALDTMRGHPDFQLVVDVIQVEISADGSANCLATENDEAALVAFEEFACGGLRILEREFNSRPGNREDPTRAQSMLMLFGHNQLSLVTTNP